MRVFPLGTCLVPASLQTEIESTIFKLQRKWTRVHSITSDGVTPSTSRLLGRGGVTDLLVHIVLVEIEYIEAVISKLGTRCQMTGKTP